MDRPQRIDGESYQSLGGLPKMISLTTASPTYQMNVNDITINVVSAAADGVGIVTLPSLAESVGRFYHIKAPTGASGGDISLYEKETGSELATYGDMDADNDELLLFSTGIAWLVAVNNVA